MKNARDNHRHCKMGFALKFLCLIIKFIVFFTGYNIRVKLLCLVELK